MNFFVKCVISETIHENRKNAVIIGLSKSASFLGGNDIRVLSHTVVRASLACFVLPVVPSSLRLIANSVAL